MTDRTPGFATLAIHAGAQPDPTTGARATPIYQTTSFVFEDVDHAASLFALQTFGNIYTRIGNPTNAVLEERVAALEGGTAGLATASGHGAQIIVFHCLMQPGDEFVASKKLYGGSINQFNHAFKNYGWNVVWPSRPTSARSRARPAIRCSRSRGRNIMASCCTRPSATSRSQLPAGCWRCATSAHAYRRSMHS